MLGRGGLLVLYSSGNGGANANSDNNGNGEKSGTALNSSPSTRLGSNLNANSKRNDAVAEPKPKSADSPPLVMGQLFDIPTALVTERIGGPPGQDPLRTLVGAINGRGKNVSCWFG
ncbi:hypothetical protein [Mycobacterium sp.]|uniref:hypothetical protein n=1 Tax=Mycobacterium sp. TaxID=1785 RepID=UPI002D8BCFE7|nr:hypothetical protein [Mycobacterium sp.]